MSAMKDLPNNQLQSALHSLGAAGYFVWENILSIDYVRETKNAMKQAQAEIVEEVGKERLLAANEMGVLRLMARFNQHFFSFLEIPQVLAVIDHTIGPTAILHLQNGFILPSFPEQKTPEVFQNTFHQDFPRYMNGYLASINIMFALDDFTEQSGSTWVVPGSHQKSYKPDSESFKHAALPIICPAGSMIVFDSTLWHAAGKNTSGKDRYAINHQFTPSFFKQQIDYVRGLGEKIILEQPARTQQLLGYYTRVVTSLDEYYRPEAQRLYRKNQG